MESGFFSGPWGEKSKQVLLGKKSISPKSRPTIMESPETPKNPKKPHFYPPLKKWVPTPKNSPQGRPPNPILGGGGGLISL